MRQRSDLLTSIREETAGLHRDLERVSRLAVPKPDLDDYGRFLLAMRRFLAVVEPALPAYPAWRPFEPSLVDRIDRDLEALGIHAPQRSPGPGLEPSVTPPASAAEAWGVAYVLEGSRLGGTALAHILRECYGDVPTGYLHSEQDEGRWASFRRRLRDHGPNPANPVDLADPADPADRCESERVTCAAARAFREITALLGPGGPAKRSEVRPAPSAET